MVPQRLLVIDAPSVYFRAFHGVPVTVTSPEGEPVNAIRGFLDVLARQVRALGSQAAVACFDADWRPAWRVELLPSYKAQRVGPDGGDQSPPELSPQVPVLEQVLDALGVARLGVAGFEADDLLGTLAERHEGPVDVLTGDRDLFQLVRDDKPVRVVYSVEKFRLVDEARIIDKYGVPGRSYADFAVLRGDPSDGLPGVAGVGDKTAAALVSRFGSVEQMLAAVDAGESAGFPAGSRARIDAAREYLAAAVAVVRVRRDVPVPALHPALNPELPREPADPAELVRLSERWGLDGPLTRLLAALSDRPA